MKVGRNDPCPCHSGRKYKHCCAARDEAAAGTERAHHAALAKAVADAMRAALAHHNAGRLTEAERLYREILAAEPRHADAMHYLGVIAHQVGDNAAAAELIAKAIAIRPDAAVYHGNLGLALCCLGRLAEGIASYRRALALQPDFADALSNLGNALRQQGRLEDAAASHRKAVALAPESAHAHNNLGVALKECGDVEGSIACYRKALQLQPAFAEAHNNLGVALKARGSDGEVMACYRQALALKPDYAEAQSNLGTALFHSGSIDAAIECHVRALQRQQSNEIRQAFVDTVKAVRPKRHFAGLAPLLAEAIAAPWARPGELAGAAVSLLKQDASFARCLGEAATPAGAERFFEQPSAAENERLLFCLLTHAPCADVEVERLLARARFALLERVLGEIDRGEIDRCEIGLGKADPGEGDAARRLALCCALARQCFINEYVFVVAADEADKLQLLRARLQQAASAGAAIPASWLAALAAYQPLHSLPGIDALLDREWPQPVAALLTQQVHEPGAERRMRARIPRATPIDEASAHVRRQYEENPYPRWVKAAPAWQPMGVEAYLHRRFPTASFAPLGRPEPLDILIAGCGTGQQSVNTAQQFPDAKVLAVDLSVASLSYALRKTQELGLGNIEYAQADILNLGSLERQFDVIEAVGVLHHLADPRAGWRMVASRLRPKGFLRLGLYSALARAEVVAARQLIAARGYAGDAQGIRSCRQALMGGEQELAGRFTRLLASPDFYSLSECRDLLFHVEEHRTSLPEIAALLSELGFTFLGFDVDAAVIARYRSRFAEDRAATDLACWHRFEAENPDTFAAMYQFWAQKTG